jgi:hypothetical protein
MPERGLRALWARWRAVLCDDPCLCESRRSIERRRHLLPSNLPDLRYTRRPVLSVHVNLPELAHDLHGGVRSRLHVYGGDLRALRHSRLPMLL